MKKLTKHWILAILIALSLTPLIWFLGKGGYLINGVDTNFPLDPVSWFQRRFFVWNSTTNAGTDFSSSTAGLFFHLIQAAPAFLGFDLQAIQIFSLVFWFLLIVFSSYLLAKTIFPKKPIIQLVFVVLYTFNTYLFNTWENVKVANLALVSGIPFGIYLLLQSSRDKITKIRLALYSFVLGIVLSGSGINPSYFISFWVTIVIFFVSDAVLNSGLKDIRRRLENFIVFFVFVLLANAFWLLPTLSFIFSTIEPSGSINKIGFTNWVQSLSENTSLLNIMRLQGAWDWYAVDTASGLPLYIPYALNYFFKLPFVLFSFLLTGLTMAAFLVYRRRLTVFYLAFGCMFLIGVFLGSGSHAPTGFIFNWFFEHVPFFSLFRSPWYIFTPMVFLSLAGLVSLFLYNLKVKDYIVYLLATILLVGNLFYSYPLITGKIFRPGRHDSFFVKFPDYVFESQKGLIDTSRSGRIIGYPDDEIEKFDWGFTGIESILGLTGDYETLFSSLNSPNAPISQVIKDFYLNLKKNQLSAAENLLAKLNAKLIFEKHDQQSLSPRFPLNFLNEELSVFGKWTFHRVAESDETQKIISAQDVYFGSPLDKLTKILQVMKKDDVLLNPKDTEVAKIKDLVQFGRNVVVAKNSQSESLYDFLYSPSKLSNRLVSRSLSSVEYLFDIPEDGFYNPTLERYKIEEFGLSTEKITTVVDGVSQEWISENLNDSHIRFGRFWFTKGEHVVRINLNSKDLVQNFIFEGKGQFTEEPNEGGSYLSILNKSEQDIFASFPVDLFDPMASYFIQFKYQQVYGNNAQILMSQSTPQTLVKSVIERLPNYPEWNDFSFYFEPVKTNSSLSVKLVAPWTKDPLGTKVFYDDLSIHKVFDNELILVQQKEEQPVSPSVSVTKKSPVLYEAEVKGAKSGHVLIFSENYSPEWKISLETDLEKKAIFNPLHFSANAYANAWYIEGTPENYKVKIYYKRQILFSLGMFLTFTAALTILVINYLKTRLRKNG